MERNNVCRLFVRLYLSICKINKQKRFIHLMTAQSEFILIYIFRSFSSQYPTTSEAQRQVDSIYIQSILQKNTIALVKYLIGNSVFLVSLPLFCLFLALAF